MRDRSRCGLLHEVGESLQNDVEHATNLAGRHHLAVQAVEATRVLWRTSLRASNPPPRPVTTWPRMFLSLTGLLLLLKDLERTKQRQTGVLQRRELASELRQDLGVDPPMAGNLDLDALLLRPSSFFALGSLAAFFFFFFFAAGLAAPTEQALLAGHPIALPDRRGKETLAANLLDGIFAAVGFDGAGGGLACRVECFVLIGGHGVLTGGVPGYSSLMVSRSTSSMVVRPS